MKNPFSILFHKKAPQEKFVPRNPISFYGKDVPLRYLHIQNIRKNMKESASLIDNLPPSSSEALNSLTSVVPGILAAGVAIMVLKSLLGKPMVDEAHSVNPTVWLKSPKGKYYSFPYYTAKRIIRARKPYLETWQFADTVPADIAYAKMLRDLR